MHSDDKGTRPLEQVEQWDLDFLLDPLVANLHLSRRDAELAVLEYKKFLWLCKVEPDVPHGMSGIVDEVWHDHILHTQRYASFCEEKIGRFIHHSPSEKTRSFPSSSVTQEKIERLFGAVQAEFWATRVGVDRETRCNSAEEEAGCGTRHPSS